MTDRELFLVILDHLVTPTECPQLRHARHELIVREIMAREERTEVARYRVRVDQRVPFAVGECGSGADKRIVESAIDLLRGDEVVVSRTKPELAVLGSAPAKESK